MSSARTVGTIAALTLREASRRRVLLALGARVHAVEPARISLEARLLGILRAGEGGDG